VQNDIIKDGIEPRRLEQQIAETDTALTTSFVDTVAIRIKPELNESVTALHKEIALLNAYASGRVIKTDADLTPASDDLILIAGLKKSLTAKMDEYVKPIKGHLSDIEAVFRPMIDLLKQAEATNKAKITAYTDLVKARQAEIERVNYEAQEVARKQAALNGGAFTVNTEPIVAPAPVRKVSTGLGSISEVKAPNTWEIENETLIPKEYWQLDTIKINRIVRAGGKIPGIRVVEHTTIRTNVTR